MESSEKNFSGVVYAGVLKFSIQVPIGTNPMLIEKIGKEFLRRNLDHLAIRFDSDYGQYAYPYAVVTDPASYLKPSEDKPGAESVKP